MYAAFARLNYKPWYAIAEFVDNSLQSALTNMELLERASIGPYCLHVEINASEESIEVRDNAAGIHGQDYARAFLPASPPPDTSGLSEFGLGMKAAASWFAKSWSVRSSALGESIERTITFDIPKIVETNCDHLLPVEQVMSAEDHYTTLILRDLHFHLRGRTIGKIKDHLRSIYRLFLRDGVLKLKMNGESLTYEPPVFLQEPFYKTPKGDSVLWHKELALDLGDGHKIKGWAAILARGSVTNAGFSIFRRRRLIQGSYGEGYRPEIIFKKPNNFVYQRLVGELEVHGFSVSHTKDGIRWEDWEDDILTWVKDQLNAEPMPLLDQAENFRVRGSATRDVLEEATRDTSQVIAQHLPPIIDRQISSSPDESPLSLELTASDEGTTHTEQVELNLEHAHRHWTVIVELVQDPGREMWYELAENKPDDQATKIHIRVNLGHPFMVRFISPGGDEIVPLTRLAAGLAIAEITAREVGVRQAGTLRMNLNELLWSALSGLIQRGEARNDDT